jgi:hypothetical protein
MKKLFLITIAIFQLSLIAQAKSNGKLTQYFKEQIETLNQAVIESENSSLITDKDSNKMWYLNQFMLRLRAPIGFDIMGFLTFQVVPETEFVWQRGLPEGWSAYKPKANYVNLLNQISF